MNKTAETAPGELRVLAGEAPAAPTEARPVSSAQHAALTTEQRRDYERGRRCYESGDWDGALDALESFAAARGGFADVHYMLGMLLDHVGRLEEASVNLSEALALNPAYTEAMVALASVYERLGDFERSRALAEQVARSALPAAGALDPTTRGKLANLEAELADAYRQVGELADAIEAYRRALDRCPTFHDIRHRLAITLREAGFPDRALAELERVRRGNPDFLDAAVQMGVTYYSMGRSEEAVKLWREVLDREPRREDARMYLRMLRQR